MSMFRLLFLPAALLAGGFVQAQVAAPADAAAIPPHCPDDAAARALSFRPEPVSQDDDTIEVEGRKLDVDSALNTDLTGRVNVRQGNRHFTADNVHIDSKDNRIDVKGGVEYRDPQVVVKGDAGFFNGDEAEFEGAQFQLPQQPARGAARSMSLSREGILTLNDVRYTTCPDGSQDWQIKARSVSLDTGERVGTARDARVEFMGVPLLRLPWISFPVGDARKSGLLFPSLGSTSSSGAQVAVPYYFNLAPNQDLTLMPTWYSRRGVDMEAQYRYLTSSSHGEVLGNLLPDDRRADRSRNRLKLSDVTELPAGWRLTLDAENVSDAQYFEDFYQGADGASVTFLPRRAQLSYSSDHLQAGALLRNFQTLDQQLTQTERPYTELPRLYASGSWQAPVGLPLVYGFDSEATDFRRSEGVEGWRVDAVPQVALDFSGPGYFMKPALAFDGTWYHLNETAPGEDRSPQRTLPIASFDTGLTFERGSGRRGQRRMTLEPRLMYLYVPYRDQSQLPVFDTGLPDLNWIELFRTNRYAGIDRIGDANQISAGITTKLYSSSSGTRFLSTTLGQIYYFRTPRVTLPDEVPQDRNVSDLIAQAELQAFKNWNLSLGMEWDQKQDRTQRTEAHLSYQPAPQSVVNLGYRYQRDRLEQTDISVAWPVSEHWRLYGRSLYSLRDNQSIEQFAGFEYNSCCWRLRAVARDYVSRRSGERDHSIYLQLELKGLSNVGQAADAFLEKAIRGYSPDSRHR